MLVYIMVELLWQPLEVYTFTKLSCRGLDMSPYLLGDAAEEISPETPPIYDLYATVNHYGNIYIGHYVATVKPPLSKEKGRKLLTARFLHFSNYNSTIITKSFVNR